MPFLTSVEERKKEEKEEEEEEDGVGYMEFSEYSLEGKY